ncbi:polysaccharide lyase [Mucilaginibacter terrae]|uniref:polysaccharide lyase n=1 Tax=Mucilaginibacter terrae TaxID=1955052 RepID=UPI0036417E47
MNGAKAARLVSALILVKLGTDNPYFRPCILQDMPADCGDSFGKQSVNQNRDQWYTLKTRVKSNLGTATNRSVLYEIDEVTLLNQSIRWIINDAYHNIQQIKFHTFRGGSDEYWELTTDGDIYMIT